MPTATSLHGVYAIADDSSERPLEELVAAFVRGGAGVVQLRAKRLGAGALLKAARAAVALCRPAEVLLLVNDRPDVAALSDADGVHLGQDDLPVAAARALLGRGKLVGVSTHSDAEIAAARAAGADYLGFGPIFSTQSKATPLPPPHGAQGLRRAVELAGPLPVVAIGGITAATAAEVAAAGAACAAAIAELCRAPDPEAATRALVAAFGRRP